MKKLSYIGSLLLLCIFSFDANSYIDIEALCRNGVKFNTQRAQWGIDMRMEMLSNCKNKNINICIKPYSENIKTQRVTDDKNLIEYLNSNQVTESMRIILVGSNTWKENAATMGLFSGKNADEISIEIYQKCLKAYEK